MLPRSRAAWAELLLPVRMPSSLGSANHNSHLDLNTTRQAAVQTARTVHECALGACIQHDRQRRAPAGTVRRQEQQPLVEEKSLFSCNTHGVPWLLLGNWGGLPSSFRAGLAAGPLKSPEPPPTMISTSTFSELKAAFPPRAPGPPLAGEPTASSLQVHASRLR